MKKKMTLAIAFLLMICSTLFAQTQTNNSLLWEISGNGLQESSYLFGTFHIICEKNLYNKLSIRAFESLPDSLLLTGISTIVLFTIAIIIIINIWVNSFYGKYTKQIRNILDELKEE